MTFQGGIFMVAIDKIQNEIIEKMATSLNNEQLIQLENVLSIVFHVSSVLFRQFAQNL